MMGALGSVVVSTKDPGGISHCPPLHTAPTGQTFAHEPQFWVSTLRLTHTGLGTACCEQAGVEGVQFGNTDAPWQHVPGARQGSIVWQAPALVDPVAPSVVLPAPQGVFPGASS